MTAVLHLLDAVILVIKKVRELLPWLALLILEIYGLVALIRRL